MDSKLNGNKTVLVLGDFMVDTRIDSTVNRIASEGIVPICKVTTRRHTLGGAGLVVSNLVSLGHKVTPVGIIGNDKSGDLLLDLLTEKKLSTKGVFISNRATTHKTRVYSGHSLVSRIDEEDTNLIGTETEKQIIQFIGQTLPSCCVVVVVDYKKGLLTNKIINNLRTNTGNLKIPVFADPKYSIKRFEGIHTIKMNETEFLTEVIPENKEKSIEYQIRDICIENKLDRLIVTLGENGVICFDSKVNKIIKTNSGKIDAVNVCGAGDIVMSVITTLELENIPIESICEISDFIGKQFVAFLGEFLVSYENILNFLKTEKIIFDKNKLKFLTNVIRKTGKTIVFTNGCFDVFHHSHLNNLEQTKTFGNVLIVGINTDNSIRRIKGETRPINPMEFRLKVLSWIPEIDFIIPFEEDTPEEIIKVIKPDVLSKGSDYTKEQIKGAEYSNRIEIVDRISNCTSTQIIHEYKLKAFSTKSEILEKKPEYFESEIVNTVWGFENILVNNNKISGKILHFKAGKQTGMQFHSNQDDIWYVSKGQLELSWIDNEKETKIKELKEGEGVKIPPYFSHQITAITDSEIIELATHLKDTF